MGDIALRSMQVGIESAYGTAVAATREWYGQGTINGVDQEPIMVSEDRGSYDEFHRASQHVLNYEWSFTGGLDLNDAVEMLLMAVNGTVTPTGSNPYVWAFAPGNTLDSATIEWDASGAIWEAPGSMVETLSMEGSANGEDVTIELAGPCKTRTTTTLTTVAAHTTNVVQGWELKLFLDAMGATPGTTEVSSTILSWNLELVNNLQRTRRGDNTRLINSLSRGRRALTGNILCEIDTATIRTLMTQQEAVTEKLIRLQLGNNVIITGSDKYYLNIDIPCAISTNIVEDDEETSVVSFDFKNMYDATNSFSYKFTVQNGRAS